MLFHFFFFPLATFWYRIPNTKDAHVAQLGERQTEDLKVLGSIPSVGSCSGSSVW